MQQVDNTRDITSKAREALAEKELDVSLVKGRIIDNAKLGLGKLRIQMELPITLEKTEAAKLLKKDLEKSGYTLNWDLKTMTADDKKNPHGMDTAYKELVISWEDSPKIPRSSSDE